MTKAAQFCKLLEVMQKRNDQLKFDEVIKFCEEATNRAAGKISVTKQIKKVDSINKITLIERTIRESEKEIEKCKNLIRFYQDDIKKLSDLLSLLWREADEIAQVCQDKCEECGKPLTTDQQKRNEELYQNIKKKGCTGEKIAYCSSCWDEYCDHALTGN